MIKYFIIQCYGKRKVKVTYLLYLWVVLVLTMVRSRQHHLRHQWSLISTFVSLNHIRHHTYFKSSYVHIQVFHILHHHTMKLLLAFKSFHPGRPIVEIGSENYFAIGCAIRQQKLVHCRFPNSAAKTILLLAPQFRQWMLLRCSQHVLQQWMLRRCRQLNFNSESHIRCNQYNLGSESQFCCRTHNSAKNTNLLQATQFQQRITNSLQNTQFDSEC